MTLIRPSEHHPLQQRLAPLPENWNDLVISAVMPAYNEAATIEQSIRRVLEVPLRVELIVVNDGSRDDTAIVLDRLHAEGLIDQVVHQARRSTGGTASRPSGTFCGST